MNKIKEIKLSLRQTRQHRCGTAAVPYSIYINIRKHFLPIHNKETFINNIIICFIVVMHKLQIISKYVVFLPTHAQLVETRHDKPTDVIVLED